MSNPVIKKAPNESLADAFAKAALNISDEQLSDQIRTHQAMAADAQSKTEDAERAFRLAEDHEVRVRSALEGLYRESNRRRIGG